MNPPSLLNVVHTVGKVESGCIAVMCDSRVVQLVNPQRMQLNQTPIHPFNVSLQVTNTPPPPRPPPNYDISTILITPVSRKS